MAFEHITAESIAQMPRYQRLMQKLNRMDRGGQTMFANAVAGGFAGEEMKRAAQYMNIGAQDRQSRERTALDTERFNVGMGMRREEFEHDKSQIPITTAIGVGGVAASGYAGLQQSNLTNVIAAQKLKDALKIRGLLGSKGYTSSASPSPLYPGV